MHYDLLPLLQKLLSKCAFHSWRIEETRDRGFRKNRFKHNSEAAPKASIPILANLFEKSHRQMLNGFFHGSDRWLQDSIRTGDSESRASEDRTLQYYGKPDRGMDRPTGDRGFSVGHGPQVSDERPRLDLFC